MERPPLRGRRRASGAARAPSAPPRRAPRGHRERLRRDRAGARLGVGSGTRRGRRRVRSGADGSARLRLFRLRGALPARRRHPRRRSTRPRPAQRLSDDPGVAGSRARARGGGADTGMGASTSSVWGRCGRRTRSSPGCSSARGSRWRRSTRPAAARPGWAAGVSAARRRPVLEQALRERVADELGAAREPELLHDVRPVRLGRAHGDVEHLRDLLVRVAEREQAQHLALALGERVLPRRAAAPPPRPRRAARRARDGRSARRRRPRGRRRRPPCRPPP